MRTTAVALAVSVLLLALGLGYAVHESWVRHVDVDRGRIAEVTSAAAASLQRRVEAINRSLVDLSMLAGDALAGDPAAARETLTRRLQELSRANADVNRFGIRDAAGAIVASSDVVMRAPPATGAEFFEAHRDTARGLVITRPFLQVNTGIPVIALSRAVTGLDGRFLGVVAATLPVSQLLDGFAGAQHLPTEIVLVRDDGAVIQYRGSASATLDVLPTALQAMRAQALIGVRPADATLDGRPGAVAWHALGGHPLTVFASVASEDLLADFFYRERLTLLVMGTILVLVAGLAIWLTAMMRSHLLRLEAESRSLESRFRDGIEAMADGVLLFDAEDRLIAWNQRFIEFMPHRPETLRVGISGRDVVASGYLLIQPHADAETVNQVIEARMRARRSLEGTELRTQKGRVIEVTDRRTSDGGLISIFRDVTDERRLIDQLSLSEGRFRDFASTSSDWFWETDAEHRLTYVSHGIRALGLTTAGALGDVLGELGNRAGRRMFDDAEAARLLARLETREAFRDLELALSGGRSIVEFAGKPLFDAEQRFAGFRGGARDVTELRRIHRRLAESEARVRDYAEAGSDWMWETDAQCRFAYVSDGVRRFGSLPSDFLGRHIDDLPWGVPADAPALAELTRAVAARAAFQDVVLPATMPDGGVHQIALTGWLLRDQAGAAVGYRGIGRDITESVRQRAEVERALIREREANAQHRRFISIASHEFRTPLAVIDSATQRLVATLADTLPAEAAKRLLRIRSSVARMTQIIDRTLASARLDEGRIEFKPELFDLAALLRELCERQRSIAPDFDIHCEAPPEFEVVADPRLLDQVFTNLLSNAVKYSGASRRVEVTLANEPGEYRIHVSDHGVGIDGDDVGQLFQRFFRARSAGGIAGTGIGLHLVRELVRMHGGEVAVASRLGAGSTFSVRLPHRRSDAFVEAAQ